MARRHVPERTCVGCRGRAPKASLVRVVRWPDGRVGADPGGKAPGRGAYVHADPACLGLALKRGAFARALRRALSAEEVGTLRAEIERIVGER